MRLPGPTHPADGAGWDATVSGGPDSVDTSRPHPARRYNYWLGGKDNFAADRASGDAIAQRFPSIPVAARQNRGFLHRAVRVLAEAGIRQFIDIGTGIPLSPNVHDTAQRIAPQSRVVYVDNDPLVMTHARALLTGHADGATGYVEADLRDPEAILADPAVRDTLDLDRPVGLLLVAVLHFLDDHDDPYGKVARLVEALPSGSHVVLSHGTFDPLPPGLAADLAELTVPAAGHGPFRPRSEQEVARFLDGMDLLEPGLVSIVDWRPEPVPETHVSASAEETAVYGAVARLP